MTAVLAPCDTCREPSLTFTSRLVHIRLVFSGKERNETKIHGEIWRNSRQRADCLYSNWTRRAGCFGGRMMRVATYSEESRLNALPGYRCNYLS